MSIAANAMYPALFDSLLAMGVENCFRGVPTCKAIDGHSWTHDRGHVTCEHCPVEIWI